MINIGKIIKTYNNKIVLDIKNLSFEQGKIYAVIGANGSGKTTLAKIISGLITDDTNKLKRIYDENNKLLNIGYLPQKPYVFDMSLENNIMINGKDKNRCDNLIELFGISYLKGKNAKKLSGGEQQKMGLARFMMKDYELAIFDEPTSAMDEMSKTNTYKIIKDYSKNKTVIIITHDIKNINDISENVLNMNDGKII